MNNLTLHFDADVSSALYLFGYVIKIVKSLGSNLDIQPLVMINIEAFVGRWI